MDGHDLYLALRDKTANADGAAMLKVLKEQKKRIKKTPALIKMRENVARMEKTRAGLVKKGGFVENAKEFARGFGHGMKQQVKARKSEIIGAGIGAVGGAAYSGIVHRRKDGQPSLAERDAEKMLREYDADARARLREGKPPGLSDKLYRNLLVASAKGAKIKADHPVASAVYHAGLGATIGGWAGNRFGPAKEETLGDIAEAYL